MSEMYAKMFQGIQLNYGDPEVRILIAGDLYPGGINESYLMDKKETNIWNDFLLETSDHDFNIVNLECPLTTTYDPIEKQGINLFAKPDVINGIVSGGFNVLSLANNHIMDMGAEGLFDTIKICEQNDILYTGVGKNINEAEKPLLLNQGDFSIAIIAIAEHEFSIASRSQPGVNPFDARKNNAQIQKVNESSDFTLVIFHGGNEFYPYPSPDFQLSCRFLIDSGADAVICHHTHVASGFEIYKNKPIFYGLGNLLFNYEGFRQDNCYQGYAASLSISKRMINQFRIIPTVQARNLPGINIMHGCEKEKFRKELISKSKSVIDSEEIENRWFDFCNSLRITYLSRLFSLNRLERKLFAEGFPVFWRINRKNLIRIKNQIHCESHRTVLLTCIDGYLSNNHEQSKNV